MMIDGKETICLQRAEGKSCVAHSELCLIKCTSGFYVKLYS